MRESRTRGSVEPQKVERELCEFVRKEIEFFDMFFQILRSELSQHLFN